MGIYIRDITLEEFSKYGEDCQMLICQGFVDEIPPHGKLIDAEAFVNKYFGKEYLSRVMTANKDDLETALVNIPLLINNAPTVISKEE